MDGKDTDYGGNMDIPSFRVLEREGKLSVGNLASAGGPVLVVNKGQKDLDFVAKGVFERILFTTDWSPTSLRALEYILGFKKLVKELDIVNVIYDKLTVRAIRELKKRLIETRARCLDEDIEAEYHLYAGETASEIILAAEEYDSTAIVMGLTRRQRFRDIFRGTPSCRVASRASLPTLMVP
ncbi:MAG: universal stress protein [Proteobacteria bacterium]|nr:universal stress protein [Pseudomonadota bacterium]